MKQLRLLIVVLVMIGSGIGQVPVDTHGNRLKNYLFSNYNPTVAPSDDRIDVNIQIAISAIYEVYSQQNRVTLGIYYRNGWNDPRLTWNPDDYGGITTVRILNRKNQRIWVPPVYVIDAQGAINFPKLDTPQVQLRNDGYIYMSRPGVVSLLHTFDLQAYPYDTQNVRMRMVAYGYSTDQIRYKQWFNKPGTNKPLYPLVMLSIAFRQHIQWRQDQIKGSVGTVKIAGKDVSYFQIEVAMVRKALTTNKIMIFPGVVICFSSFNTYFIRITDNLRIQVSSSTLLTLILFLVMIIKFLPLQGANPDIEMFFMTLVLVVFGIIVFILIMIQYINYYNKINQKYQNQLIKTKNELYKQKYKEFKKQLNKQRKENLEKPLEHKDIQPILDQEEAPPLSGILGQQNKNQSQLGKGENQENESLVKKEQKPRQKGRFRQVVAKVKKYLSPAFIDNLFFVVFSCFFLFNQISNFKKIQELKQTLT